MQSDVGMRRAMNQDAAAIVPERAADDLGKEDKRFLIVADGMGAHAAGELASKIAVETVPLTFCKSKQTAPADALREAIREANERIYAKGSSSPEFEGMGTTCSCLVLADGLALVGHVGDSRVYRLRKGILEQLTFDHSLVWEMAAASNVSEDKVPAYIPKNVITRSLGPHKMVNVDLEGPYPVEKDDVYLLCSDGLTGVVDDPTIGVLMNVLAPEQAASTLVDLANLGGGPDNISVVVAKANPSGRVIKSDCSTEKKSPAWAAWIATIIFLVVCGWQAWEQNHLAAFLASAAAIITYVTTLLPKHKEILEPSISQTGGVHGNGPYREYDCTSSRDTASAMRDLVHEMANIDSNEEHPFTEEEQNSYSVAIKEADGLLENNQANEAICRYSALIRLRMQSSDESESEDQEIEIQE